MHVTTEHIAQVVNALMGFEPNVTRECVQFKLQTTQQCVDIILSVETSSKLASEDIQAVRLGFFFTDKAGVPLNFKRRGLADTLSFLFCLQNNVLWGSLKVYESADMLQVYLAYIQQVTLKELQEFYNNDKSCKLVDSIMFMAEEWEELQGVLEGFCRGELNEYTDIELALIPPAGSC